MNFQPKGSELLWKINKMLPQSSNTFPNILGILTLVLIYTIYSFSLAKAYLINVVNTLDPDLIRKTLIDIKKKKEAKEMEDNPIMLTNAFMMQL